MVSFFISCVSRWGDSQLRGKYTRRRIRFAIRRNTYFGLRNSTHLTSRPGNRIPASQAGQGSQPPRQLKPRQPRQQRREERREGKAQDPSKPPGLFHVEQRRDGKGECASGSALTHCPFKHPSRTRRRQALPFATIGELANAFAGESEQSQKRAFNINKAAGIAQTIWEAFLLISA